MAAELKDSVSPPHAITEVTPMTIRLSLVSTQTAVTYLFRAPPGEFGWACCTVNDVTGELLITSDWGNWSHRWDPRPSCLGAPTLTAFIGSRGDVDYLARKLQPDARQRWSAEATARALRRQLCQRRLEDGREQFKGRLDPEDMPGGKPLSHLVEPVGRFTADGMPIYSDRMTAGSRAARRWRIDGSPYEPLPYLTRDAARQLWDGIGDIASEVGCSDLFYSRIQDLGDFGDYVTEEPWEYGQTEQTPEDKALRAIVLPALIDACGRGAENGHDGFYLGTPSPGERPAPGAIVCPRCAHASSSPAEVHPCDGGRMVTSNGEAWGQRVRPETNAERLNGGDETMMEQYRCKRELPPNFLLAKGSHDDFERGACLMEAVAFVAGEPHSYHPECACPILSEIGCVLNDRWSDDERQLLMPLIPRLIGTRATRDVEKARAYAMADAGIREIVPMGLDAVKWTDLADRMRAIAPVVDMASAKAALAICQQIRDEARKRPYTAAYAAAYAAAAAADTAYAAAFSVAAFSDAYDACDASFSAARAAAACAYAAELSPEERVHALDTLRLAARPIVEATLRAYERVIAIA